MNGPQHIRWAFKLSHWQPTLGDLQRCMGLIQREEIDRLLKFVFLDDFKASLIGRLMIRKFVHRVTGKANAQIHIARDERGKPYYPADTVSFDFNVSHQSDYTVLAGYANGTEHSERIKVGIDVMKMEYSGGKPLSEFFRLMDRNFSAHEWRYIRQPANEQDQIGRFMRNWCLKESYVKNVGVGITVDLRQISFLISPTPPTLTQNSICQSTRVTLSNDGDANAEVAEDWFFEESLLDPHHCVAVAIHDPSRKYYSSAEGQQQQQHHSYDFLTFDGLIANLDALHSEWDESICCEILGKETK